MTLRTENKRWLIKRSTASGVQPTIPGSGATSQYDHTQGGWQNTDLYVGEIFANSADDKLWYRSDGGIILLNSGTGSTVSTFLDLTDCPSSYSGYENYSVVVNPTATGLSFAIISGQTSTLLDLTDTPDTYATYAGYSLVVNSGETGTEWSLINNSFLGLTDTPAKFGDPGECLIVNPGGNALEFVKISDYVVTINSDQTITDTKTFEHIITGDITFTGLTLNGLLENTSINNITTDISLSSATDNELGTTLAIKTYVDLSLAAAAGITGYTGQWVTTDTNQSITGEKIFTAPLLTTDLSATTLTLTDSIQLNIAAYQYIGDPTVDGSYRIYINPVGNLTTEKLESSIWVDKTQTGDEIEETYTVLSGDILNVISIPIVINTYTLYPSECFNLISLLAYWTDGSTNYSYSSANYLYSIDLFDDSEIYNKQLATIISLADGRNSYSSSPGGDYSYLPVGDLKLMLTTTELDAADAGDRNLVITLKYNIKTIPLL